MEMRRLRGRLTGLVNFEHVTVEAMLGRHELQFLGPAKTKLTCQST
jgi:hypothetical protein